MLVCAVNLLTAMDLEVSTSAQKNIQNGLLKSVTLYRHYITES